MADAQSIQAPRRSVPFTIDGQSFTTDDVSQTAGDLLKLAGLNPGNYDLGELHGKEHIETRRFDDNDLVEIDKDARFVSIRRSGDVA